MSRNKTSYIRYFLMPVLLMLYACSVEPLKVISNLDPKFDPARYSTVQVTTSSQEQSDLATAINEQIVSTLSDKGYKVEQADASLIIIYNLHLTEKGSRTRESVAVGDHVIEKPKTDEFDSASIRVHAYDPTLKSYVWMAGSYRNLSDVDQSAIDDSRIEDRINELFETLPETE